MMRFLQVCFACAIAAVPLLMLQSEQWLIIYGAIVVGVTILALVTFSAKLMRSALVLATTMFFLLAAPILLSIIANAPDDIRMEPLVIILCYAALSQILFRPNDQSSVPKFFFVVGLVHVITTILTCYFTIDPGFLSIRGLLVERRAAFINYEVMHPNFIGLLCVVIALASVGLQRIWVRVALIGFAVLVAWIVSSRASMLGIAAAVAGPFLCHLLMLRYSGRRAVAQTFLILLAGAGAGVVLSNSPLADFFSNDVLLIHDNFRGIDSGFSERIEIWNAAIELWRQSPIFGVGFGQHIDLLQFDTYAHNMALVLLSETGVLGLLGFIVFSSIALANGIGLLAQGNRTLGVYVVTSVLVYWAYGIFEGKAISAGNPLSAVFFLLCFASTQFSRQRVQRPVLAARVPPGPMAVSQRRILESMSDKVVSRP